MFVCNGVVVARMVLCWEKKEVMERERRRCDTEKARAHAGLPCLLRTLFFFKEGLVCPSLLVDMRKAFASRLLMSGYPTDNNEQTGNPPPRRHHTSHHASNQYLSTMSGDYASRLKEYHNKGVVGLPENCETQRSLQAKLSHLVRLLQEAKVVVITGAGISTAAGIPDFRGPKGVWTLEAQQKKAQAAAERRKRKRSETTTTVIKDAATTDDPTPAPEKKAIMNFTQAQPTLTHRALYFLWKQKAIDFVITQNVDGLHRRSGLDRSALAILHGCVFTEKCEACGREYFRDKEVPGISFQRTGKRCVSCGSHLRDTLLDWCDHLPEDDWDRCHEICETADVILTLGTSLRMEPCASLVKLAKKYVIVNLQETPYDDEATLVIRYRVDDLMTLLLNKLGYPETWESEVSNPEIQRVSESLCPKYGNKWWKHPADNDGDDQSYTR